MIEGESGLLSICPPWFTPQYIPSKKKLIWPNGVQTLIFYGTEPDGPRGKQSDLVWCDELAKWQYPEETLDNILFGLRLGASPICGITTTPRPIKVIMELIKRPDCITVRGNTQENKDNLSDIFINTVISKYEGTRLGRQELEGEILDDNPGALWKREWIDAARVTKHPDLERVVVAVDPQAAAPTESGEGAETGIVGVGRGKAPEGAPFQKLPHFYILDDMSVYATPNGWGSQAVSGYNKLKADRIVGEKNNGGEMVRSTIHNVDPNIPFKPVWASRGKETRAEPVSTLYEQGRVHHVGSFRELEDQLCEWVPGAKSPDRLDALVWGVTELMEAPTIPAPSPPVFTERTKSKVKGIRDLLG
jgi:phage terminase large subunit-like protein